MPLVVIEEDGRFRPVTPRPRVSVPFADDGRGTLSTALPLAIAALVVLAGFLFG